jgi:hypothetical protein
MLFQFFLIFFSRLCLGDLYYASASQVSQRTTESEQERRRLIIQIAKTQAGEKYQEELEQHEQQRKLRELEHDLRTKQLKRKAELAQQQAELQVLEEEERETNRNPS